jgi:nitric oxide reductase NorE protein
LKQSKRLVHGKVQTASIDRERHAAIPGDSGVWVFIQADMCAFAVFFLLFAFGRIAQPTLYEASRQQLDLGLGLANTLILLSSGAFMARAARQARRDDWQGTRLSLVLTMAIGVLFAVSKLVEWKSKIAHGVTLTTNEFFTYYFVFTGIHFLHFVIGIGVLAVLIARSKGGADSAGQVRWIEAGGAYWHMVDLLWIVLFAMLYLMRAT